MEAETSGDKTQLLYFAWRQIKMIKALLKGLMWGIIIIAILLAFMIKR